MTTCGEVLAGLVRSADDYLVAGRRLGPLMYIGCLSTVVLGGASTIGGVALGYENGISGMWLVFWIGAGVIALGILMSTRLSRLGVYTVAEMLENRYGAPSRLISALIIAAYALIITVTSTIAIGTVFNVILGLSPVVAVSLLTPRPSEESVVAWERRLTEGGTARTPEQG